MIAFLDTEFTDLVIDPRLLSVGIVLGQGDSREFYAEVTDSERIGGASRYARSAVLPQFGTVIGAACSYAALGKRLCDFLAALARTLNAGQVIEVAYESDMDWMLFRRAITDAGPGRWASIKSALLPVNVYNMAGFAVGARAATTYFEAQSQAPLWRHHALCDARALRISYAAANASRGDQALLA